MIIKNYLSLLLYLFLMGCSSKSSESCSIPLDLEFFNIDENFVFLSWAEDEKSKRIHITPRGTEPPSNPRHYNSSFFYYDSPFFPGDFTILNDLAPETEYDVYISNECDSENFSETIGPLMFKTLPFLEGCTQPDNIIYTSESVGSITLNWDGYDESLWEIYYGETGFFLDFLDPPLESKSSTFTIKNLDPDNAYDFYIRSKCGSLEFSSFRELLNINTL